MVSSLRWYNAIRYIPSSHYLKQDSQNHGLLKCFQTTLSQLKFIILWQVLLSCGSQMTITVYDSNCAPAKEAGLVTHKTTGSHKTRVARTRFCTHLSVFSVTQAQNQIFWKYTGPCQSHECRSQHLQKAEFGTKLRLSLFSRGPPSAENASQESNTHRDALRSIWFEMNQKRTLQFPLNPKTFIPYVSIRKFIWTL